MTADEAIQLIRPHEHALVACELVPVWPAVCGGLFFMKLVGGRLVLMKLTPTGRTLRLPVAVTGPRHVRVLLTWEERMTADAAYASTYITNMEHHQARRWQIYTEGGSHGQQERSRAHDHDGHA